MEIVGYATFYMKAEFENAESNYCKYEFEFSKPLEKAFLEGLLKDTAVVFQRMGKCPIRVSYVTKEEYEASNTKPTITHEWETDEHGEFTTKTTVEQEIEK